MENNLPINQVLQGDCIEVLATLPEKSVDLIFADPPYNLQLHNTLYRPNMSLVDAVDDDWDKFTSFEEYDAFSKGWLEACRRVLKDTGTLWVIGSYHNIYRLGAILQNVGYWFLNDIVWIKTNPMPNFRGVRFTNAHETMLWVSKFKGARYTFNHHAMKALNDEKQMRSDWLLSICSGSERIRQHGVKAHPTQKPEALLYRVILASSNPGDVVLDPFFGTGTTGAVASRLGRKWIGIEKQAGYVEVARQRLSAITPELFPDDLLDVRGRRRMEERIPFGTLLENGLLQPGQMLYFQRDKKKAAYIKPDGTLKLNGFQGSIHMVGRELMNGSPCNGWEHWFYETDEGELKVIDELRKKVREGK
jgi:site-specific DNA-methyltransferase (adenine-specific)